jgi:uncharacterized metal-binding protein
MTVECATCKPFACRAGRIDAAPEGCPMRGAFPDFSSLYATEPMRALAYHAARVEAEGYCRWTRAREVVELAHRMNYGRIGVAHCRDMGREARLAGRWLTDGGLEVVVPQDVDDCDPIGQAELFRARRTDLNVIVGMCVGHDTLFIRHAGAPVTSLVVRDCRLRHNPTAAVSTRSGYLKSVLYRYQEPLAEEAFHGWDDHLLDRLAREVRDAGERRADAPCRLEEVMEFARRAGVRHLGIVFCSGFREEAGHLNAVLRGNGFRVTSVCCKTGAVLKERLGLTHAEQVRPGTAEVMCNPLAQAELVDREGVELVLLLGQCVGHDSATMAHLRTPAVCLVAKDRVLAHNTVAALYELDREP